MRAHLLAVALLLTTLVACGDDSDGDTIASDPAGSSTQMPTDIPAAPGTVHTFTIATVMDTGAPQLCLGPIAESYPPQCSGPPIDGWDWDEHQGTYDAEQGTRWGEYSVSGTWDGATFTYVDAVSAALYDPMPMPPPDYPTPATKHSSAELADIAEDLGELPGALTFYSDMGHALVDVVYDDGSLQEWADDIYGAGVVVVTSMLVDEG